MPEQGFNVEAARKAGYSDDEILSHLTETRRFDINGALKAGYSKQEIIGHLSSTAPKSQTWLDEVGNAVSHWWDQVNPVAAMKGLADATAHPIAFARAYGQQNQEIARKAEDSFKKGNYAEGMRHALGYVLNGIPGVGATLDTAGDRAGSGDLSGAVGDTLGVATAMFGPKALGKLPAIKTPRILPKNPNPVEAAAMAYVEGEGVPVSAAAKTGNPYVRGVQKMADSTPVGAVVAARAERATTNGLRDLSGRLADQTHPAPVVPEQAGAGVRSALESNIRSSNETAAKNYAKFREIEGDPANLETVQVGLDAEGKPVHKDIPLPVDMRPVKQALRPIYERYRRSMPIAQQRASQGLKALENILNEEDLKPASIAEMDLGAIKEAARAEMPELRDVSQGLAARAVKELDSAIRSKVSQARRTVKAGEAAPAESAPAAEAAAAGTVFDAGSVVAGGPDTRVRVPGSDRSYTARYEVRDLGDLQASHSGRSFQRNPNYPFENERDYTRQANQGKVATNATPREFDPAYLLSDNPDATNGPVIVDRNGNVLGGNGRTMILERVYQQNPVGSVAYRKLLALKAPQFGIDPAAIRSMKRPVLVRVLDDVRNPAEAIADFNKKPTAELTAAERMVADSRRVSSGTLEDLAGRLEAAGPESTLAQVLEGKAGVQVLDSLIKDGAITPQERGALVSGETLTPAGRARINGMVLGRFFRDPAQLDQIPASIRGKLERIAAPLAKVEGRGAWSLASPVSEALDLLERSRVAGFDNLSDFVNQGGLFEMQNYSPEAQTLARHLQTTKPTELTRMVRQFAGDAAYAEAGGSLFGDAPTPAQSFTAAFGGEAPTLVPAAPSPQRRPVPVVSAPKVQYTDAGGNAMSALERGRAATSAKYQTAAILKQLRDEPVQAFKQMIYAKDAGIDFLRQVAKEAPAELPKIGRAYLEDLWTKATSQGGFDRTQGVWQEWQNLGPETKKLLFRNPLMIENLDKFFLAAKKIAENPNPSGSGIVSWIAGQSALAVTHPGTGIPYLIGAGALSKMMHSPGGVLALTNGMRISLNRTAPMAAKVAAVGQILKMAGKDAERFTMPNAAQSSDPSRRTGPPATALFPQ